MKTIRKNKFIARGKKRVAKSRSSAAGRSSLSPAADWKLRRSRGLQVIESSALGSLRWLVHGFSTRSGGTSELAAAHAEEAHAGSSRARGSIEPALNLGFTDWDASERVQANRHRFFHALGADGWRVVTLRQIHSDIVHLVESPRRKTSTSAGASDLPATGSLAIDSPNGDAPQGDALITRDARHLLGVQTADCVPILLADTRQSRGRRGPFRLARHARAHRAKRLSAACKWNSARDRAMWLPRSAPHRAAAATKWAAKSRRRSHAQFPNAREWFEGPFDALASGEDDRQLAALADHDAAGARASAAHARNSICSPRIAPFWRDAGRAERADFFVGLCTACRTDLLFSYRRERITGQADGRDWNSLTSGGGIAARLVRRFSLECDLELSRDFRGSDAL